MSGLYKEKLKETFSKAALNYSKEAYMQKEAARMLVDHLKKHIIHPGEILEIGCGTGFVTQKILNKYPEHFFHITDFAEEMVSYCKKRYHKPNTKFYNLDGETIDQNNKYTLIISGLTIQWFQNPKNGIQKLLEALKPGGVFAFSFLNPKSFPEWQEICFRENIPFTGNQLPSFYQFRNLRGLLITHYKDEIIQMKYSNARDFFKSLKKMGIQQKNHQSIITPYEMKRLINQWNQEEVIVSYHLTLGYIIKL